MSFEPKEYIRATSVDDVINLLHKYGPRAKIVAGNTTLNEITKKGLLDRVEILIDINQLPLQYITQGKRYIKFGGTATLSSVYETLLSWNEIGYQCLTDALRCVRPIQVRNTATVGGCVCSGVPFLDFPIALTATDAQIKITFKDKVRLMPILDFMKKYSYGLTLKKALITEIIVPKNRGRFSSKYMKFSRTQLGEALVGAAARVGFAGDSSKYNSVAVAVGGSGIDVTRLERLECWLEGKDFDDRLLDKISDLFQGALDPVSDYDASAAFKFHIAKVIVKRLLVSISK